MSRRKLIMVFDHFFTWLSSFVNNYINYIIIRISRGGRRDCRFERRDATSPANSGSSEQIHRRAFRGYQLPLFLGNGQTRDATFQHRDGQMAMGRRSRLRQQRGIQLPLA